MEQAASCSIWLPHLLKVTKVQLPNLYLRNLDRAAYCVTLENENAAAVRPAMSAPLASGRGERLFDNP